jgi:hypothetical protein
MTQRSYIDTWSVSFSQEVNLPSLISSGQVLSAVTLLNLGTHAGDPATVVSSTAAQFAYDPATHTLTWSLDGLAGDGAASLPDGRYQLRISAALVAGLAGVALDGDADLHAGGDYVLTFRRAAGDASGDGTVDAADDAIVAASFGKAVGTPGFDPNADLDRDGTITVRDRIIVRNHRSDLGTFGDTTPPTVNAVVIQEGLAQRSWVDTFTVTFSEDVVAQGLIGTGEITSAVTLMNLGVNTAVDPDQSVALAPGQFRYDAATHTLTWQFDAFYDTRASLPDGYYQLTLSSTLFADLAGNALDGNADGRPGPDLVVSFHRLLADTDGDGTVTLADDLVVGGSYGRTSGDPGFDPNADADRSGTVDLRDRTLIRNRLDQAIMITSGSRDGAVSGPIVLLPAGPAMAPPPAPERAPAPAVVPAPQSAKLRALPPVVAVTTPDLSPVTGTPYLPRASAPPEEPALGDWIVLAPVAGGSVHLAGAPVAEGVRATWQTVAYAPGRAVSEHVSVSPPQIALHIPAALGRHQLAIAAPLPPMLFASPLPPAADAPAAPQPATQPATQPGEAGVLHPAQPPQTHRPTTAQGPADTARAASAERSPLAGAGPDWSRADALTGPLSEAPAPQSAPAGPLPLTPAEAPACDRISVGRRLAAALAALPVFLGATALVRGRRARRDRRDE